VPKSGWHPTPQKAVSEPLKRETSYSQHARPTLSYCKPVQKEKLFRKREGVRSAWDMK